MRPETLMRAPVSLRGPIRVSMRWITQILNLARSRKQLAQLDDRLLDDIGLTRDVAAREAARRAWDAPGHWLQ